MKDAFDQIDSVTSETCRGSSQKEAFHTQVLQTKCAFMLVSFPSQLKAANTKALPRYGEVRAKAAPSVSAPCFTLARLLRF